MVLVPENTLERLQQCHHILTPPVTQTLTTLDNEMSNILSSKEFHDEAKAKLNNQVFQRYLTCYDQRKDHPLHVKLTVVKPTETPKPEQSKEPTEEPALEKSISTALEQEVMKSVPNFLQEQSASIVGHSIKYIKKKLHDVFIALRYCSLFPNISAMFWKT